MTLDIGIGSNYRSLRVYGGGQDSWSWSYFQIRSTFCEAQGLTNLIGLALFWRDGGCMVVGNLIISSGYWKIDQQHSRRQGHSHESVLSLLVIFIIEDNLCQV